MTATQLKKQKKQQQQQQHLKDEKSNSKHVSRSRSADSTSKAVKAAAPTLAASLPIRSEPARPSPDTTSAAPDSFVKLDDVKPVLDADAIKAGRQEVWLLQLPSKLAPEELDGRRLELHGGKGQLGEGAGIIGSVSLQAGVKMDVLQHDPAMASTMVVLSGSASGRIQPLKLARRLAVVEAAEAAPAFDAYDDEEEHEQPGKADGAAAAEGGVAGVSAKKAKKRARGEEPGSGGSTPVTGGKMEHRPAGLGSGAVVRAGGGSAAKSKKRRGAGESPAEAAARGAEAREYTGSDKAKKVKKNKKKEKEKEKKKKRTGSGGGE